MNRVKFSGVRLRSAKRTMLVLLAVMACDVSVTPPAEVPTIAISLREVRFFAPAGSDTPDIASVIISNNGRGSLEGLEFGEVVYEGDAADMQPARHHSIPSERTPLRSTRCWLAPATAPARSLSRSRSAGHKASAFRATR